MTTLGDSLARLGGADLEVLRRAPRAARSRFVQFALVLLSTAGLAVLSMGFALHTGLDLPVAVAVACGLGWGCVILNLDRMLTSNLDPRGGVWRLVLLVAPRFVMAVLLGIVISTPLVLQVFHSEIRATMAEVNADQQGDFGHSVARTAQAVELDQTEQQIAADQSVIQGHVPVFSPELTIAQSAATVAEQNYNDQKTATAKVYARMQCELDGSQCAGASGKHGSGPLYQALHHQYATDVVDTDKARKVSSAAQAKVDALEKKAEATAGQTAAAARVQARKELPGLLTKRDQLQKVVALQVQHGSQNIGDNTGILAQIDALQVLDHRNSAAKHAHWAVGALFFMIELMPVLVKTLTSFGPKSAYERILELDDSAATDSAKGEVDKKRAIAADLRAQEERLGVKANAFVAAKMEDVLDQALTSWGNSVAAVQRSTGSPSPSGAGPIQALSATASPYPGTPSGGPSPAGPQPVPQPAGAQPVVPAQTTVVLPDSAPVAATAGASASTVPLTRAMPGRSGVTVSVAAGGSGIHSRMEVSTAYDHPGVNGSRADHSDGLLRSGPAVPGVPSPTSGASGLTDDGDASATEAGVPADDAHAQIVRSKFHLPDSEDL